MTPKQYRQVERRTARMNRELEQWAAARRRGRRRWDWESWLMLAAMLVTMTLAAVAAWRS